MNHPLPATPATERALAAYRAIRHFFEKEDRLPNCGELARSLGAVAVHIFILVPVGCGLTLAQTDMLSPQQYEQIMRDICRMENDGPIQIKVTCGPHYQRVKREMRGEAADGDRARA